MTYDKEAEYVKRETFIWLDNQISDKEMQKLLSKFSTKQFRRMLCTKDTSVRDMARRFQYMLGKNEQPELNVTNIDFIYVKGKEIISSLYYIDVNVLNKHDKIIISEDVLFDAVWVNGHKKSSMYNNVVEKLKGRNITVLLNNKFLDEKSKIISELGYKYIILNDDFTTPECDLLLGKAFRSKVVYK